jgi:hypothetical protein
VNFPFEIVKLFRRSFLSFAVVFCCFLIVCCFVMPSASWFRRIRAKRKKVREKDADDDVEFDMGEGVSQRVIEDDDAGKDERRKVGAKQKRDRRRIIEEHETEDERIERLRINATKEQERRKVEKETEIEEHKVHRVQVDTTRKRKGRAERNDKETDLEKSARQKEEAE